MKRLIIAAAIMAATSARAETPEVAHRYCSEIGKVADQMMLHRQIGFDAADLLDAYAPHGTIGTETRYHILNMVSIAIKYPVADEVEDKRRYRQRFVEDMTSKCLRDITEKFNSLK